MKSELILYQTEDNRTRIEVRLENETVWLTQNQMNAPYLAGFLRREDEKLEAAQVRRIIAAWTKSAATWNFESRPGRAAARSCHFYLRIRLRLLHR
jgi:hypothetical protein